VRNVLLIITFIVVSCECKADKEEGEIIYSCRQVKYIGNIKRVTEMVVTEYKMETDKRILTLEYRDD